MNTGLVQTGASRGNGRRHRRRTLDKPILPLNSQVSPGKRVGCRACGEGVLSQDRQTDIGMAITAQEPQSSH